jgi:hypothetical protein
MTDDSRDTGILETWAEGGLVPCAGPFVVGGRPPVWVDRVADPQATARARPLLRRIVAAFRDVYGHGEPVDRGSWGEYLVCARRHRRSIEWAYGLASYRPLAAVEHAGAPLPDRCPDCGAPLAFAYEQGDLMRALAGKMRDRPFHGALVVDASGGVHGFCYGWIDTVENLWADIAYLFAATDADAEGFLRAVGASTSGGVGPQAGALLVAEVGLTLPYRDEALFFALARAFFTSLPAAQRDLPALAVSEPDKRAYMYLEAQGYRPVFRRPGASATVVLGSVAGSVDLWTRAASEIRERCAEAAAVWRRRIRADRGDAAGGSAA